ncbi:EamA family transporter [Crenobacter sp. HX-7-9]|uniref:EamA family transporter n=2 Tax=Crenobacter caeni TaxID=2705474 RepID=A0A6B2KTD6_9NEIS|nr:EamA family transporter [Crenobacter caeni]
MFLSSSLMGGIGAFARYINTSGDVISFSRNFSGVVCMILILLVTRRFGAVRDTRFSAGMLFSGIFLGLLSMLYVMSTQMTTLSNAAFLIYTGPIYSTLLATWLLKEPFTKGTALMLTAVFFGCLMIIGIINYTPETGVVIGLDLDPKYTAGNLVALLSGVAYGLFLFVSRYRSDVSGDVRAFYNFIFASLTIGVFIMMWQPDMSRMDASSWMWLVSAAVITGFGAFFLLTVAAKYLMASELACISYQETIMATLLGIAFFSEPLSMMQGVGGALIVAGGVGQIFFSTRTVKVEELPEKARGHQVHIEEVKPL